MGRLPERGDRTRFVRTIATSFEDVCDALRQKVRQQGAPVLRCDVQVRIAVERVLEQLIDARSQLSGKQTALIDQNLHGALRSATQHVGIARSGRLFASREQSNERVELVRQ